MFKAFVLLLILKLYASSFVKKNFDDLFNLDADEAFASEMGEDLYKARQRLQSATIDPKYQNIINFALSNEKNTTHLHSNAISKSPNISTTERISVATIPPELAIEQIDLTQRQLKWRRMNRQLNSVLNSTRTVTDYLTDSNFDTLTQRFDQIVAETETKRPKTRREVYTDSDSWEFKTKRRETKKRLRDLMTHFVYVTRYKLPYAQLLRKKYWDSPVYKLGYLFALLRHLKNMQKWILFAFTANGYQGKTIVGTLYYNLKLFEKIQRLDVDIKDVVLLIKKWEYKGNMESNPKYYDYSLEKFDEP